MRFLKTMRNMIFDEGCGEGVNLVKDDKAEAHWNFFKIIIFLY